MKTNALVAYNPVNRDPSFHSSDHPELWAKLDTVTTLDDCPFPLVTPTFKVLLFGTHCMQGKHTPGSGRFAVVAYVKHCGHTAHDRIGFFEGLEDFDHYGKVFTGLSYSIANWENRIEFFRRTLCPVCAVYEHVRWAHFHAHERTNPKNRTLARFDLMMDTNFLNWQEFVSREDFEKSIKSPENLKLSLRHDPK